jgi:hypothetical protein
MKEKRTRGRELSYAAPIAPRSSCLAGPGLRVGSLPFFYQRPLAEDRIPSHGLAFSQRLFGSRPRRDEKSCNSTCNLQPVFQIPPLRASIHFPKLPSSVYDLVAAKFNVRLALCFDIHPICLL